MDYGFTEFLSRIAIGAGTVFALLVTLGVSLPRRSLVDQHRRPSTK